MGQCTIGRARIVLSPDDTINEKYSNWVHQNTSNTSVGNIVVEAINSGKFTEHFKDNPKFQTAIEKGLLKMNGNTFKGFVREYERQVIPSVKATATKTQGEIKGNFSSEEAKRTALNYTADITVDIYNKLLYKVGAKKLNTNNGREFIKTSIRNRILDSLYNRDIDYCDIIKNNKVKERLEEYYKQFKQANSAINNLAKKIALSKTKQEINKYTEFRNEAIEAKQAAVEQILAISSDLYKNDLNSEKNQNYTVLATEVFTDSWFDEVRKLPKVFDIQDVLKENTEANKANTQSKYDEYNIETILSEEDVASIDSSTANWNDSLYNDFIQHFDGRIRLYLNNLYKLKSTNKLDTGQYEYYTNNELGVPETMGAAYIIAQISTFGNFNSINDFINSIVNIANNIPGLECLIKLADDMKVDRVFANMVASNLAKPAIIKNMIIYDGEAFKVIHSNPNAYASTQIFNRLKSVGKISISQEYDDSISSKVKDYIESINNIKNPENFIELRSKIGKFILDYFNKYFTGINPDIISDYYYTTNNLYKLSRAKELLNIIKEYNERIIDIKNQINKETSRVYNVNKAFKQQIANTLGVVEYKDIPLSSKQREVFNPDNINYDKIDLPIAKLANILAEHMPSSVDLNSGNAENNMSSDIIKNSYLTNFLKQLNDILDRNDGTKDERGLKLLKEFYGKSSYFDHSPILYGIKVGNTYIREGLFRKNSNGQITISPNARNLINIILFNGIKNTNVRTGQLYQNMSSSDYLTSIIASYFNPLNYNYKYTEGVNNYCQVLLRIPSDASNQYAVQMPKYRFDDFYTYDENATKNFIYDKLVSPYISLKGIEEEFTKQVSAAINNDGKLEVLFDKHKANFIDTQEAAEILYNGGINGVLSLYPYKKLHNGKTLPLVVKDSKNNNSFIIYLKSYDANYKAGKDFKVASVISLNTIKKEVYNPLYMMNLEEDVRKDIEEVLTNYFNNNIKDINNIAFKYKGIVRNYNKNSAIYLGFRQHIAADISRMFSAINDVFEEVKDENGIIHYVTKTNTDNLFDNYHYKGTIVDSETGKLTGQVFSINKLFNVNNYNIQDIIEKAIPLYGNDGLFVLRKDGRLEVNLNRTDLINEDFTPNYDNILAKFDDILQNWLNEYTLYINEEISKYSLVNQYYSENQIHEAIFNQTLAYMDFDDLFEGSSKFYKDAQTFLKRDKEIQAGGSAYMGGVDLSDSISAPIHDMQSGDGSVLQIQILKQDKTKSTIPVHNYDGDGVLTARNGFRAVTIKNTVTTFDVANDIYNKVKDRLIQEGQTEEIAKNIAKNIADGYGFSGTKTKVNDAQSYITIEEFIRRKWMDGTLTDYGDLLDKLLDENYELTPQDYANISSKIQVQKNFYYDIAFDNNSGIYYPRQIKNAEFVLIPRFIKETELEQLYNIMKENDINQINTIETSKAANINTLEFWDNKGIANNDKFKQQLKDIPDAIQTYYYRYLYKQQDVVDHIENEENKAGIQVLKKIQDNVIPGTKAAKAANTIQNLLVENIKEDYNKLLEECGWTTDSQGNIVNKNGGDDLNFDEFYRKARREAARLGMDENFLDYITPASNGRPSMPTFMNNVSNKLESIAQAVFNTSIIRQTLPGFHAVQVTNVGYSRKLNYTVTDEGITAEIMVAPWNNEIKEIIRKYGKEEAIKQLQQIGADEFIGYRIPTEGKQSIVKMKVVDFLDDSQGSTIIVPNEWVAQSGSDFDVDTIYSIVHELKLSNEVIGTDENNRTQKTFLNIKDEGRAKRNNEILEAFKTILSDSSSFEENASRSNYDDITKSKNKYNIERGLTTSVYDVFTEVRFMQNAIDGRKLKAFSVNRDTFASISNKVHGILHQDYGIKVKYDLSKYNKELIEQGYNIETSDENTVTVNHRTLGWSKNNRNVVGKLITPYTSQTTAHILDAIKEGVVFNETDYTFGVFKTLIDLGVDYDTAISFLAQAPITDLNNEYFKVNSAFTSSYKTVIENVYREFAKRHGFTLNGEAIKDSASINDIIKATLGRPDFADKYKEYWSLSNINEIPALDETKFAKNINDSSNPYHYFGVLQIFNHLKQVTDVIEDIASCSRPDATGARQTVRATRKLLDNIEQYSTDKEHSILYSDGGSGFLKELYGFDGDIKNIDVQKAKYPYLAAMLKYGISTSVDVNKQLFLTASDKFTAFVNRFETRIGKELNEDEYNAFKKYYVCSLYAGLEFINSPIVLNKFGNIISNPDYSKYGPQFWETEKGRVFGYIEPAENGDFFEVADFANPNEEELNKYLLLTPLQKVLFLSKALPYDDNIFNKLYINKTSDRNYKEKGYTNNKISINTNNSNIENLYQQFSDAFFNDNPLIRLAAIDLVKYSFFVEGFNYKNGAISKIIPNKVLYTEVNSNGMNIIEALNKSFDIQLEKDDIYFNRFIRSHSDILTSLNIPVPAANDKSQNIGNVLNQYREKVNTLQSDNSVKEEYTGYISIHVDNSTVDLLKYLRLDTKQKDVKYIKLNSTIEPNSKRKTSLYEVRPILSYDDITKKEYVTKFNLIPLNLLEENEWGEESINYQNNTFYTEKFYKEQHTETVNPIDFIIPRYYRQIQTFENRESIETIIAEGTGNSVELAKRAKNQIKKWYNEGRKIQGGENFGLIQLKGALVNTVLGINKEVSSKESIQDIVVDDAGTILTIKIIPTHQYDKSIKKLKEGKKARISQYVQDFALNNPDFYYSKVDEENLGIYRIVPIYEATKEELEQNVQEKIQENSSEEKYSAFSGVIDHINSMTNGIKRVEETHDISALIMRELQYQKNHGNTGAADAIKLLSIKGFVPNDSEKLESYKVDIYKIAAKYYRDKADDILKQLDNFVCNGEIYKVDDDALYDALREEPERVNNLYRLILEASTFGNQIPGILDLQMTGEDKETSDNIARIQRAIKGVKNNPKIHKAFTNVYNIYLAKEYATNPYVKLGIVAMTDIFGDSDWFSANIGDVTHLNHKQIQVVTKIATTELEKARLRAKDELVAFDKWWTEMEHKLGADNMQKILKKLIDEKGQFIQPYIQKFIDDKENWKEKLNAAEKFGNSSIEYLKVKHDRDKWYMENTVQPYIKEYYDERWKNEDYILRTAPKAYSEYLTIEQEYYNLDKYAVLNDAQKLRKRQLAEKMQDMRTNEFLNAFLTKRADINDKYFEWVESEEFKKTLNKYKDILDSYAKQNPTLTMWDMYTNPDVGFDKYRDAYDWIRTNCIYTFDDEAKHQIYDAFATLKRSDDRTKKGIVKILNKVNPEDRYDIAHQIIGTKYTLEDARAIKAITEQKYNPYGEIDEDGNLVVNPYNENVEAYDSDANLIKNVPQTPILTEEFFLKYFLADDERTPETRKLKRKYYTYINNIIKRGINKDGDISAELLVQNCTIDELKTLANLYKELRLINKKANTTYEQDNSEDTKNKEKKPFEFKTNHPALLKQKLYIENASGEIRSILEDIFYEKNKEGRTIYKGKVPLGNKYIYGYVDLAKDATGEYTSEAKKYIDQKKTDARKLIDDNVEFVPTEYYWKAWKDAEARGEEAFNEWYEANHVYNPYKHNWEPITIWTSMRAKPTGNLKLHADYIGNKSNTTKTPRKDAEVGFDSNGNKIKKNVKNSKYDDNIGLEYNGSETYKNPIYSGLTETEQEVLEKLQKIARKYAINNFQQRFLNKGFAPRVYEKETDFVDTLNDVANIFGLGKRNYMDKDWHSIVDFEHDFDAEFSMYKLLKAKGYKEPPKRPVQAVNESDAAYQQRLDDWKAEVKKINADNLALDNSVFSRNWKDVYRRLIQEGEEYVAKDKMKDLLYLTLEDLRNRDAYALSNRNKFFGDIIKNKGTSTIQQESYYTTSQSATVDTFQNWIRRYLFNEYKKYNKGTKIADRIQTMNSSKFMMFNLMSGINNVNVGVLNMIMEGSASTYFSNTQLLKGMTQYTMNVAGFINNFINDEVSNEIVALSELFNVDDYDRIQAPFQDFKSNAVDKFNSVAYAFLSSGEHFMRNSAMLAMLESHKIYEDPNNKGKYVIGTLSDYKQSIEIAAIDSTLKQFINENGEDSAFYRSLHDLFYQVYIPRIRNNKREAMKFDRLQKDVINDFIRSNIFKGENKLQSVQRRKKFIDAYLTTKKALNTRAEEDFAKFETVRQQLEFNRDEKREVIKANSKLTQDHIADLIDKAKSVNKKIHGVYDKLGAAKIERGLLGGLIMQYKKHLYPGFMKHWRRRGYYNEHRGTYEYGAIQSLLDFLTTDFRYKGSINDHWAESQIASDEQETQKSIQGLFKMFINNSIDLGINWQLLPDWQKQNIIRLCADLGGAMVALLVIMAIYGLVDDDDLKESKVLNEMLYLADRLYGEATMYDIGLLSNGLWTEFSNFKDKPIVAMDYIYDGYKMWNYFTQWATNPDYEPNYKRGTYKGENKMWVTLRKNIPAYRQWQQIQHINAHNTYYKVNENNFMQTLFKNIGLAARGSNTYNDKDPLYSLNR